MVTAQQYNFHVKELHSSEAEKHLKCKTCGKLFFYQSKLKKHMLSHSSTLHYCDNKCGYFTKYPGNLRLHLKHGRCLTSKKRKEIKESIPVPIRESYSNGSEDDVHAL